MEEDYVDHYNILGVDNDKETPFTNKELSKVYRKLALKYHPDKQTQKKLTEAQRNRIQKQFEEISKANEILQDAGTRATFDAKYFAKKAILLRYKAQDKETKRKVFSSLSFARITIYNRSTTYENAKRVLLYMRRK